MLPSGQDLSTRMQSLANTQCGVKSDTPAKTENETETRCKCRLFGNPTQMVHTGTHDGPQQDRSKHMPYQITYEMRIVCPAKSEAEQF
jgi:hypothetical protein